jgi:hypothetical protein
VRLRGLFARHPAWPVSALLLGYPVWWALGLADFAWFLLAVPMVARMVAWRTRGNRRIRVPPGFGIWLLFLAIAILGVAVITQTAPGTVISPVSHRVLSYADRTLTYLGVTVLLVYAGNLTEKELPRRKFAWMLGLVGIVTVLGGLAGMLAPHFQFHSPALYLLPQSAQANPFIQASMHPGLAQLQAVLGSSASGRPKAPFDYTNLWGECLTILIPFLLVGWWDRGTRRQRLIAGVTIVVAFVPLLYSLNRGAWIAAVVSIVYLAIRLAARGKPAVLGAVLAGVAVAAVLLAANPQNLVTTRVKHGKSNHLRSQLDKLAIADGLASPVVGYGDTRQQQGSAKGLAVGPRPQCPICGQLAVGSTGQVWLTLVTTGVVGTAFYFGFFAFGVWRFRRDRSPYAMAGVLVLLLSFIYMFVYDAVGAPLGFTMLAYALMWKNDIYLRERRPPAAGAGAAAGGIHWQPIQAEPALAGAGT